MELNELEMKNSTSTSLAPWMIVLIAVLLSCVSAYVISDTLLNKHAEKSTPVYMMDMQGIIADRINEFSEQKNITQSEATSIGLKWGAALEGSIEALSAELGQPIYIRESVVAGGTDVTDEIKRRVNVRMNK